MKPPDFNENLAVDEGGPVEFKEANCPIFINADLIVAGFCPL